MNASNYILGATNSAAERLDLQHKLFEKTSQQLLIEAGLKPGMQVLEIGPGTGAMTQWLADQLRGQGKLTAIDIDPFYLGLTKKSVAGYDNVNVMMQDIQKIDQLEQQFDLIYCRMVLHHLINPEQVVEMLVNNLTPGGVLVCEEPPTIQHMYAHPHSAALDKMIALVLQYFSLHSINYQIAYKMAAVMRKLGLTIKVEKITQPLLVQNTRKLLSMGLNDISNNLLKNNLISEVDFKQLAINLEQEISQADTVTFLQMFQVAAVKPG